MEVAFFLAVWALGLSWMLDHEGAGGSRIPGLDWKLGLAGALVVATRPEGAASVAVLGIAAGVLTLRATHSYNAALATIARAGTPAIGFVILQSVVNRIATGEWLANGAIVKLALHNPFMTRQEKWDNYKFHLQYCIDRLTEHHFADDKIYGWLDNYVQRHFPDSKPFGWVVVVLALIALTSKRTRFPAAVLLASTASFILLVAMNGQVRWQNERYTMPAVAWLFVAAALGLGVLLTRGPKFILLRASWPARVALAGALMWMFVQHQRDKMADQIWFFGRACRNIRDLHILAGRLLRNIRPMPQRVAVGDAGALMYASDLPGLDIIGLGGFHRMPFARASVHGVGATVELIARMAPSDRPDALALYPSWWAEFPEWFGKQIAAVWVEGNVICGGAEKAIYRADWHLLNTGAHPLHIEPDEHVVDEVDVADLISEDEHDYHFDGPSTGFVQMRRLPDPRNLTRDLFDAGRLLLTDHSERFEIKAPSFGASARLIIRSVPVDWGTLEVEIDGANVAAAAIEPSDGWAELSIPIESSRQTGARLRIVLTPRSMREWSNYHMWLVEKP